MNRRIKQDCPEILLNGNFLPPIIPLEVTNRCNVSCIMCDTAQRIKKSKNQPPAVWLTGNLIKSLLSQKGRIWSVVLSGGHGEPLLNREIIEVIRFLKKRGALVEVFSNGTLLTRKMSEQLVRARLDRIFLSLHGSQKITAEHIMERSNFEKVIDNLREFQKIKDENASPLPVVEIMFVAMKRNINELPEIVLLANELGIKAVHVQSLNERQREELVDLQGQSLLWNPDLFRDQWKKAKDLADKMNIRLNVNSPYSSIIAGEKFSLSCNDDHITKKFIQLPHGKTRHCLFPFAKPSLTLGGRIGLCCSSNGRYVLMGNALESGFFTVWTGEKYIQLRRALLSGKNLPPYCIDCDRAPVVDPYILQMDIALRQLLVAPNIDAIKFFLKNRKWYPEYVSAMKEIAVQPHPYPDFRKILVRFFSFPLSKKVIVLKKNFFIYFPYLKYQ